jgi:hypothetical protein
MPIGARAGRLAVSPAREPEGVFKIWLPDQGSNLGPAD